MVGTSERLRARLIRSFIWWWRVDLSTLLWHDRPWVPRALTVARQGCAHLNGLKQEANRQWLGLDRRIYTDRMMRWRVQDARRYYELLWALIVTLCHCRSHNYSTWWFSRGRCQVHLMAVAELNIRSQGMEVFEGIPKRRSFLNYFIDAWRAIREKYYMESHLLAIEVKKAERASEDAGLMPNQPSRI